MKRIPILIILLLILIAGIGLVVWNKPDHSLKIDIELPEDVEQWLITELKKAPRKKSGLLKEPFFRNSETMKLVGYIRGFNSDFELKQTTIATNNAISNEDFLAIVQVYPDGRFETEIEASYPSMYSFSLGAFRVEFYGEPGMVTGIILDWENYYFRDIEDMQAETRFMGPLGRLNQELLSVAWPQYYRWLAMEGRNLSYEEFKEKIIDRWDHAKAILAQAVSQRELLTETIEIQQRKIDVEFSLVLMTQVLFRETEIKRNGIPDNYYDFLYRFSLDDLFLLLSKDFYFFINRLGIHPTDREAAAGIRKIMDAQETLMGNIVKVHKLKLIFDECEKKEAKQMLDDFISQVKEPFLQEEVRRIYDINFERGKAYELPQGEGADVFRRIIEPYKGKYLLVDFWGIYCGGCLLNIRQQKELRARLKDHPSLAFIFVASGDVNHPSPRYKEFVEEQELEYSYLLSEEEYRSLQLQFRFIGIPRYILVSPEGIILDDNYRSHSFVKDVQKLSGIEIEI